jgi:low affinity Fe/Cu permease
MPKMSSGLEKFSQLAVRWSGSAWALCLASATIVGWLAVGPFFGYSNTWQLAINTGTTIITFLMVFLIQRAQNKESQSVQLKLNEIVAALQGASNRLINVEDLSEDEVHKLHEDYQKLAHRVQGSNSPGDPHSVEETEGNRQRSTPFTGLRPFELK